MKPIIKFDSLPKPVLAFVVIVLLVGLGIADLETGPDYSFSLFYLLPVSIAVWYLGLAAGIFTSVISVAISFFSALAQYNISIKQQVFIPYWDAITQLGILLVVNYILVSLKQRLAKEKELARTDLITEVGNSRFFFEEANQEIRRASRYMHPFSIAYADIDNFKTVNDNHGHNAGDHLLRIVAQAMRSSIRSTDILARMGGDEFAILLPETDFEMSQATLQRLRQNVLAITQENKYPVTISFGVVTYLHPPKNTEEMIKIADDLMYTAKNDGKNNIKHMVWDLSEIYKAGI